jgi:NADH-quinone oxidoreductase subunit M
MNQLGFPIISLVIFFPILGTLLLMLIEKERKDILRGAALVIAVIEFIISLPLLFYFDSGTPAMQFVEHVPWIQNLGISYYIGIDGISLSC